MNIALRPANRRTFAKLALFSALMFGVGYALVPLYSVFCAVTGLNQIGVDRQPVNLQLDTGRVVNIEFDANVHHLPWKFRPVQTHLGVHPGELMQTEFEIINTRNEAVTGQAIPSYSPPEAAQYFKKISCFCFSKQTLAAGQVQRMPLVFVVDPALPKEMGTITLSYTFFEVEGNAVANSGDGAGKS